MTPPEGHERGWFKKHPALTLTALVFFGCIFVIISAELGARLFVPKWAPRSEERVKFWSYHELLGWVSKPEQKGRFNHRDFSIEVAINSHGQRDDEYNYERNEKKRMLIIGDSFGWGFGVEHHERFCEILEKKHQGWEIINASVSGYGTDQQYLYLRERGILFKPDVVLLLFHNSDFANNLNAQEYWYNKPFFVVDGGVLELKNTPVPSASAEQKLKRFLLGRTYIGKVIYTTARQLRHSLAGPGSTVTFQEFNPVSKVVVQATHDVTSRLLKAMHDLSNDNGAKFIIVSIPMEPIGREWLQEVTSAEDIPYLPLDPFFKKKPRKTHFPHDGHWNRVGHERAAAAIDKFLLELEIFQ